MKPLDQRIIACFDQSNVEWCNLCVLHLLLELEERLKAHLYTLLCGPHQDHSASSLLQMFFRQLSVKMLHQEHRCINLDSHRPCPQSRQLMRLSDLFRPL